MLKLELPNEPTMSVPKGGRLLGLGRDASYAAAHRGDLPTIKLGRKLRVPTARLAAMLGLTWDCAADEGDKA